MKRKIIESFGDWLSRNLNVKIDNFSEIGNIILANIKMVPDDGTEPVEYPQTTIFQVAKVDDGKYYKLKDIGYEDKNNKDLAAVPHYIKSPNAGRTYTLSKEQFEKVMMFRAPSPQQQMPM